MNIEEIREYAISLPEVEEGFPFGKETLVFKTSNKIFLLLSLDEIPAQFNVKCDPEKAIDLRAKYPNVLPGYHMNKKHWNTVVLDRSMPLGLLKEMIKDSYLLVKTKKK